MALSNATLAAAVGPPQLSYHLMGAADITPDPTPWGPVAAVLLCLLPIIFLLLTTLLKPCLLPSSLSLPLSAALLALIRLAYLASPPLLVLAHMVVGALEGLVPLAVIFGAVLLFEVMAATGCLQFLMANVRRLSAGSPIAEVFLIGWAFAYTISGVGGFSTPMALATPMLVSLGHDPLNSLVAVVGLNGLAAHLGSVGMAVWFGFKSLSLDRTAILHIGLKSAAVVGACSFVVAPAAASFLVPWRDLACNAGFVLLSVASAVVPTVLFALISPEFPLVAGGLISMLVTWLLVKYGIGLRPPCTQHTPADIEMGTEGQDFSNKHAQPAATAAGGLKQPPPAATETLFAALPTPLGAAGAAAGPPQHSPSPILIRAPASPSASSRSRSGSRSPRSSNSPVSSQQSLHSPFEPYCSLPWGVPLLGDRLWADYRGSAFRPTPDKNYVDGVDNEHKRPSTNDIIARRSRSLIAAAAAVGGLAVQQPGTPASAAGAGPSCIFRCPSCAADHAEIMEAVAELHRQLSAASAGTPHARAAPAAVSRETDSPCQQQKQPQQLLPALSVVNHATGDHIVISGFDKLSVALRLLLHPGHLNTWGHPSKALSPDTPHLPAWLTSAPLSPVRLLEVLLRTMPIWLTVLLLLITHLPQLKLGELLRSTSPSFTLYLGTLGALSLSPALVLQLQSVFTQLDANWKAELLYVPCFIPFVVVSCVTLLMFRRELVRAGGHWTHPFSTAWQKLSGTVFAMLGALVLAQLMSAGGTGSPAFIIAFYLTTWMGRGYLAIAGFLGALGSFVSGSVMGSNMTQGAIQAVAAQRLSLPVTGLLAVQVAGACAGKMVCISSILSAKVVMSELQGVSESEVIRRTGPLALLLVLLAQLMGLAWTLGGLWPD